MRKLSAWIHRISNWKISLITLVIFIAFTALVLPGQSAQADQFGEEVGSVDTSMYYSPSELFEIAEAYGEEGRAAYIRARWTFDVIWPLVYTAFLATVTSVLVRRAFLERSGWQLLNLVPLLAMLFDFLENTAASGVMALIPTEIDLARLAGICVYPSKMAAGWRQFYSAAGFAGSLGNQSAKKLKYRI